MLRVSDRATLDHAAVAGTLERARAALVSRLVAGRHWEGCLSSSALSTATAVIAFDEMARGSSGSDDAERLAGPTHRGLAWLVDHQNADGGWGDTTASASNVSTTVLCWAALARHEDAPSCGEAARRAAAWLASVIGSLEPDAVADAIRRRYGRDRTFSAPILTVCALTGRLGPDGWRLVPQLPFELAMLPPRVFGWARLPVVSYALPALIAIGQLRHATRPTRNVLTRPLRDTARRPTLELLTTLQPPNGGFLEATPLTSFVVASLAAAGQAGHPAARRGVDFLVNSIREDGSWPIDTNLATWTTTLSVQALAAGGGGPSRLAGEARGGILDWLIAQQHRERHPYTQAAPGGWAWTDLPGGVPDADDTAGALLALRHLWFPLPGETGESQILDAVHAGVDWLLQLQNRDGGIPTFCRGWGYLPFDRSAPDLTAHALRAWMAWRVQCPERSRAMDRAVRQALGYLGRSQRSDGSWAPLWFGSESAPGEENPTYGTTRVLLALSELAGAGDLAPGMMDRGVRWILAAQHPDGGWGGAPGVPASLEETALAVEALAAVAARAASADAGDRERVLAALGPGVDWIVRRTGEGRRFPASPIGLYFARLWYFEELYPLIFTVAALERASSSL